MEQQARPRQEGDNSSEVYTTEALSGQPTQHVQVHTSFHPGIVHVQCITIQSGRKDHQIFQVEEAGQPAWSGQLRVRLCDWSLHGQKAPYHNQPRPYMCNKCTVAMSYYRRPPIHVHQRFKLSSLVLKHTVHMYCTHTCRRIQVMFINEVCAIVHENIIINTRPQIKVAG